MFSRKKHIKLQLVFDGPLALSKILEIRMRVAPSNTCQYEFDDV